MTSNTGTCCFPYCYATVSLQFYIITYPLLGPFHRPNVRFQVQNYTSFVPLTFYDSAKKIQLVSITKKTQTHQYRELVVISGEKKAGRDQKKVADLEVQTTRYKISYKDVLYNTVNIASIL